MRGRFGWIGAGVLLVGVVAVLAVGFAVFANTNLLADSNEGSDRADRAVEPTGAKNEPPQAAEKPEKETAAKAEPEKDKPEEEPKEESKEEKNRKDKPDEELSDEEQVNVANTFSAPKETASASASASSSASAEATEASAEATEVSSASASASASEETTQASASASAPEETTEASAEATEVSSASASASASEETTEASASASASAPEETTEASASAAAAAPADTTMSLEVPAIGVSVPVYEGTGEDSLSAGTGHLEGSGYPWVPGSNTYVAGHRVGYPGTGSDYVFWDLPSLGVGDAVYLTDANGKTYEYAVSEILEVPITDLSVTAPVAGRDMVSLQTCIEDYGDYWSEGPDWNVRYVVRADKV